VHAALIGPHLVEEGPPLGAAFAGAAAALALGALTVGQPRYDSWAPTAVCGVLGLIALSYLLSRTVGVPLLIGQAERLDALGMVTTATELVGAVLAAVLTRKDNG
jgi:hypothetical protein